MKFTITIAYCFYLNSLFSQFNSDLPILENLSKADIKLTEPLWPGRKVVFTQNCNSSLPDTVGNGIVQFENLRILKNHVSANIEFKDTIVKKLIFEFNLKDKDAWNYFEIPKNGFTELKKNSFYINYSIGEFEYNCFVFKRKVTLIKTLVTK